MRRKAAYFTVAAVALILILAFLFRLNFFLYHRQAPVVWDAAGYNIQAREFSAAFSAWPDRCNGIRFQPPANPLRSSRENVRGRLRTRWEIRWGPWWQIAPPVSSSSTIFPSGREE